MDNYVVVRIFLIVLAVATLIVLISKYNSKQGFTDSEGFYVDEDQFLKLQEELLPQPSVAPQPIATSRPVASVSAEQPKPFLDPTTQQEFKAVNFNSDSVAPDTPPQVQPSDIFPKDKLTAEDLLPNDAANSKWSEVNPAGQGSVKDQNFLQAGYHVGLNTTQGMMKNANMQLRSDPINPKSVVSPWLNSSYEPDLSRKPLEIGESGDV